MEDDLENKIWAHMDEFKKNVDLIIMHPKTWEDLVKYTLSYGYLYSQVGDSLKYKGIKVLRSFDLDEGFFELR